jgi:uncharacterized protein YdbL (DUF1318 family)
MGANIGDLDRLNTPYPDLVTAINSLSFLGVTVSNVEANIANLTSEVANVSAATAGFASNISILQANVGDLGDLRTNEKSNLTYAINEVWANVGPLPNLITGAKSNIVYSINEIAGRLNALTTDEVPEGPSGANVYFSNARSRLALSVLGDSLSYNNVAGILQYTGSNLANTDELPEGLSNLYYTNARAQAFLSSWLQFSPPLGWDNANGIVSLDSLLTDNVPEGEVNLYFTNTRARHAISSGTNLIAYDAVTGIFTSNFSGNIGVESFNGLTGELTVTSDDVPEGSINLYFTTPNWNTRLAGTFTSNIAENPDSNLANTTVGNVYFTNARARAALSNVDSTIIYDEANGTIAVNTGALISGVSNVNGLNGDVVLYTSNVTEDPDPLLANTDIGAVYFTNARARHSITVGGAAEYDAATGNIWVPGPYDFAFRRRHYTLAANSNTVYGLDDNGHNLTIDLAAATDVFFNGIKLRSPQHYTIYDDTVNGLGNANVVLTFTALAGTEISTQELTGNAAIMQGYITEQRTNYTENLSNLGSTADIICDLNSGQTTAFYADINQSANVSFINPPVTANQVFLFTLFLAFGAGNSGVYNLNFTANISWDDQAAPSFSSSPGVLEAVTFFTMNGGYTYYGYKNLSQATIHIV